MGQESNDPIILTIDDEAVIRTSFKNYLEDYQYTVLEAENGQKGVEIYQNQKVDLILVDLRMPVMDGLEVLSAIREQNKDLPIIVISGTGDITDVVDALRLGASDYLLKPVNDMTILLHAVEKGLERSRLIEENRNYQFTLESQVEQKTEELAIVNNRLKGVVEAAKRLMGCGELHDSGTLLVEEFCQQITAEGGSIYQVMDDGLKKVGHMGREHDYDFLPLPLEEGSVYGRALEVKEPFLTPSGAETYSNPSCIVFPILKRSGQVRAVISLHDKMDPPFTLQDQEIGTILMSYAAESLEAAQARSALKRNEELLMQAQKMEAIGTLAGGIAHDFNNILSAIVGYTDLSLYSNECTPKIENNLQRVKKAGERAKDLVGQILAFSRTEAYQEKPLDIAPIIKEALKLLRATIPSSITIKKNVPSDLGRVLADPTKIHQIIMNLCTNAVHAIDQNEGLINIEFARIVTADHVAAAENIQEKNCLCLTVSDNGQGMSENTTRKIFEPYFTTKEKGEGTGLGLAVVHGIVRANGGVITVTSSPGKGSTFRLYFPCIEDRDDHERFEPELEVNPGTERILFVDDELELVDMARQMLEKLGYSVEVLTSSVEALEELEKDSDRFDLVITDQTMPGLSGLELARKIKILKPTLPVILYTGYSATIDAEEAKRIGIKEFLLKPLNMVELSAVVRSVLDINSLSEN